VSGRSAPGRREGRRTGQERGAALDALWRRLDGEEDIGERVDLVDGETDLNVDVDIESELRWRYERRTTVDVDTTGIDASGVDRSDPGCSRAVDDGNERGQRSLDAPGTVGLESVAGSACVWGCWRGVRRWHHLVP
jgi:hypothetical protein